MLETILDIFIAHELRNTEFVGRRISLTPSEKKMDDIRLYFNDIDFKNMFGSGESEQKHLLKNDYLFDVVSLKDKSYLGFIRVIHPTKAISNDIEYHVGFIVKNLYQALCIYEASMLFLFLGVFRYRKIPITVISKTNRLGITFAKKLGFRLAQDENNNQTFRFAWSDHTKKRLARLLRNSADRINPTIKKKTIIVGAISLALSFYQKWNFLVSSKWSHKLRSDR